MIAFFITYTLISWWSKFNVLPMFYLDHTNTMLLTLYISSFCETLNEPRPNHLGKTAGLPQIRAPPRK